MKEYEYTTKTVTIEGKSYPAYFPKKHSRVTGIVCEAIDLNRDDPWANIPAWHWTFYVKYKGENEWKKGPFDSPHGGIFPVLFRLETEKEQNRFLRQEQIRTLKKTISDAQKALKQLTKSS